MHPYGHRVTVQPSTVETDEEQRPSGLIVKYEQEYGNNPVRRGVVLEVAEIAKRTDDPPFDTGNVVFYSAFDTIGDTDVVMTGNILAWE